MKLKFTLLLTFAFFIKLHAQAPYFNWGFDLGSGAIERIRDFQIDSKRNVIVIGVFSDAFDIDPSTNTHTITSSGLQDVFIAKYNSKGILLWANSLGGKKKDDISKIALDSLDNIFVYGKFSGVVDFDPGANTDSLMSKGTGDNIFISKFDLNCNYVWTKIIGSDLTNSISAIDFEIDNIGNLYLTGSFSNTIDFNPGPKIFHLSALAKTTNMFLAKLSNAGNFIWAEKFSSNKVSPTPQMIYFDKRQNYLYCTGYFSGAFYTGIGADTLKSSSNSEDIFISKFDTSGNPLWAKKLGEIQSDRANAIVGDTAGNIYLTGTYSTLIDMDPNAGTDTLFATPGKSTIDVFFAKYTSAGTLIWSKSIGGSNFESSTNIDISNDGQLYILGYFTGKDFDANPANDTAYVFSNNTSDQNLFIAKYANDGNYIWSSSIVGSTFVAPVNLEIDDKNNFYLAMFSNSQSLNLSLGVDNNLVSNNGANDFVIAKYNWCKLNTKLELVQNTLICKQDSATYQWINCETNTPIVGQNSTTFTPIQDGSYCVEIFVNGCSQFSECIIVTGTSIKKLNYEDDFLTIYPNPSKELITVSINGNSFKNETLKVAVTDVLGNEIFISENATIKNDKIKTINVSALSNGVYFLKVNNVVKQFIKN